MAKRTKYRDVVDSVSNPFLKRNPDKRVVEVLASEDGITGKRFAYISPDFEAENSTPYTVGLEGIVLSNGNVDAYRETKILLSGAGNGEAVGALDAGLPAKSSYSGYVNEANVIGFGNQLIVAATAGLAAEITDDDASAETITVVSTSASDTNWILIMGVNASGVTLSEYIKMTGTTAVAGSVVFTTIYGVIILDVDSIIRGTATAAVGTIDVDNTTSATLLVQLTAADKNKGIKFVTNEKAYGRRIQATASALDADTPDFIIFGKDYAGEEIFEVVNFAATNDILVKITSGRFDKVYGMAIGSFATRTVALDNMKSEEMYVGLSNAFNDLTETTNTQTGAKAKVKSDDAGDTTQTLYLYGEDGGVLVYQAIVLTGTTAVTTTPDFDIVHGAWLSAATLGTVTIYLTDESTVMVAFDGSAFLSAAMMSPIGGNVAYSGLGYAARDGIVKITNSSASADVLIVEGKDLDGAVQRELVTLSSGVIVTANKYASIDHIAGIKPAVTEYLILEGNAATPDHKIKGYINEKADAIGDDVEVVLR